MDYEYYDVNFILKLILLFKKKNIAFTDDELTNYFYNNNKGIIKINERYNNTYLSLEVIIHNASNNFNNLKVLFEYANKNNIILNLNDQHDKFYDYPFYAVTRANSIKLLELFIEYANKNNIILEINNKFDPKKSPTYTAICLRNNINIMRLLIGYAEKNKILIDLNIMYIGNALIDRIMNYDNMEMLNMLIEYAERNKIIIKYYKRNLRLLKKSYKHIKLLNIANNHKNVFEYVDL